MAWTTPPDFIAGTVVTETDLDILSADLNYLLNRPSGSKLRDNAATYTSTSTSYADIDATNLIVTLSISGTAVLLGFTGLCRNTTNGSHIFFDIDVDGTRLGTAGVDGLAVLVGNAGITTVRQNVSFTVLATGLSAGSHTFKIQWKVDANTANLESGTAGTLTDSIPNFWGVEVA